MKKIGILGSGAMGIGIAQVFAAAECEVILFDHQVSALEKAQEELELTVEKLIAKGRMTQSRADRLMQNIRFEQGLNAFHDRELIVEAIVERLEEKQQVFRDIELVVKKSCILASNTSSLSITSIASACKKPDRVIGIHFFNPAPVMALVEIIPAIQTKIELAEELRAWLGSLGKHPVIAKDTPGFIVNRIARPYYGEALRVLEEGLADEATIDQAMVSLGGFRMGPFELMDFIGNDVNYQVTLSVFEAFYYDPRYKPSLIQKRMVEAGYLGRKSGRGYYRYHPENGSKTATNPVGTTPVSATTDDSAATETEKSKLQQQIFTRILMMLINEAADALFLNIASREDLDLAMTKGVNYPKGLLKWADEIGAGRILEEMDGLYAVYREDRYRLSPLLRKMAATGQTFY